MDNEPNWHWHTLFSILHVLVRSAVILFYIFRQIERCFVVFSLFFFFFFVINFPFILPYFFFNFTGLLDFFCYFIFSNFSFLFGGGCSFCGASSFSKILKCIQVSYEVIAGRQYELRVSVRVFRRKNNWRQTKKTQRRITSGAINKY